MTTTTPIPLIDNYFLRALREADNAALAQVIRAVSAEYGLSAEKGYSVADPSLDRLSELYLAPAAQYWLVINKSGIIVGGAGFAPLIGEPTVCELQKMYLLNEARGLGLGKRLAQGVLAKAKERGYQCCYLETTAILPEALHLYQKLGFRPCPRLGNTGHDDCEITLMLKL
ncbi:GNAT family N-acetyltransferase [Oceanisphaera avium]|uniref:GNAT family N-acetyltransferase n=2 Tax=Oceanisphaera avium TaxID=1903694 RepID=A0A1Y0D167_9GAMM|nr:GNAT family N-acetyltransferase [Oceanisphaera avium]